MLDVSFFPCIFRVAIGNSESQIEKRQVEKCKVLPLQEQQEETPQGKMQRFKSAKNSEKLFFFVRQREFAQNYT